MTNPTGPPRVDATPTKGAPIPEAAVTPLAQADGDSGQGPAPDDLDDAVRDAQGIGRW